MPKPAPSLAALLTLALSATATVQHAAAQLPPPPGPAAPLPPPPPAAPPLAPAAAPTPAPAAETPSVPPPALAPTPQASAPAASAPAASAPAASAPAATAAAPAENAAAATSVELAASADSGATAPELTAHTDAPSSADDSARAESLREAPSLTGSTGTLRLQRAGSGRKGTFRFGFSTNYFGSSGFLCPPCEQPGGASTNVTDSVTRVGANLALSVTPLDFLEGYLGVHSYSTSNDRGSSELLQVLGDTNFGIKAFMPLEPDQLFTAGGAAEVLLLNGSGDVSVGSADFTLRGLVSADFNNKSDKAERLPLRFHGNLSYTFDNSSNLIDETEQQRGRRITRIERFGLDINRVDTLQVGLGFEGVWDLVHPFLEWTVDLPANRQDYTCIRSRTYGGDVCLKDDGSFSAVPSRLSAGAHVYPWLEGLAFLGAVDIGTGGTSSFWEEVAPEAPYNLYFGVSYAVDTKPRVITKTVEVKSAAPAPLLTPKRATVWGVVVEAGTNMGLAGAQVRYDGRDWTGMLTDSQGRFRTAELNPGTYTFRVVTQGYREGTCTAVVAAPDAAAGSGASTTAPVGASPGTTVPSATDPSAGTTPATTPAANPFSPTLAPVVPSGSSAKPGMPTDAFAISGPPAVRCELKALPKVGNMNGSLLDGDTGTEVALAQIKITDKLGRELTLQSDSQGAFRFERIPEGKVQITVTAPGFLKNVTEWEILPLKDITAQIVMNPKPKQANVRLTAKEVLLNGGIRFEVASAKLPPATVRLLEELAEFLNEHNELVLLEIQAKGDDGDPGLGKDRANVIRDTLVRLGVNATRLQANGFATTDAVKILVLKRK